MADVLWNRDAAAHLLRRAGFGSTPRELDKFVSLGYEASISRIVDYESVSNADLDARLDEYDLELGHVRNYFTWWLLRMLYTARPLEEKMAFFWHDHFATALPKAPQIMLKAQIDLFRDMAVDNFREILVAVSKDGAMLTWLDNIFNRVGNPNENFARELLELFTMGEGNGYTETDVSEVARCFTGWTIAQDGPHFSMGIHDKDAKVVLGVYIPAGGGISDGEKVCDIVVTRPETARYMATKFLETFVYPRPSDATVEKFASVFVSKNYSTRELLRAIFRSDEFWSEQARFAIVKNPIEFVLGALKSLDATVATWPLWEEIGAMGLILMTPPDVSGWDGDLDWINTSRLLNRANFANALATNRSSTTGHSFDVKAMLEGRQFTKPKQLVDHVLRVLGPIPLSKADKKHLIRYVKESPSGEPGAFTLDDATIDLKVRGLVHLIMTIPEYNLE